MALYPCVNICRHSLSFLIVVHYLMRLLNFQWIMLTWYFTFKYIFFSHKIVHTEKTVWLVILLFCTFQAFSSNGDNDSNGNFKKINDIILMTAFSKEKRCWAIEMSPQCIYSIVKLSDLLVQGRRMYQVSCYISQLDLRL